MLTPRALHHRIEPALLRTTRTAASGPGFVAVPTAEFPRRGHELVQVAREIMPEFALAADDEELGDRFGIQTLGDIVAAETDGAHGSSANISPGPEEGVVGRGGRGGGTEGRSRHELEVGSAHRRRQIGVAGRFQGWGVERGRGHGKLGRCGEGGSVRSGREAGSYGRCSLGFGEGLMLELREEVEGRHSRDRCRQQVGVRAWALDGRFMHQTFAVDAFDDDFGWKLRECLDISRRTTWPTRGTPRRATDIRLTALVCDLHVHRVGHYPGQQRQHGSSGRSGNRFSDQAVSI